MGHKVNPVGMRLGIVREWGSIWYAGKSYGEYLMQDLEIRRFIKDRLKRAAVADIQVSRRSGNIRVKVSVGRPGVIFGKNGMDMGTVQKELSEQIGNQAFIEIIEERNPQLNAKLIGEAVVAQLEKRIPFRRAMKMAVQMAMKSGAEGVKVNCAGRLGGVEIARTEWYREGKVPLHTLRADIDYAFSEALTTYGKIGVKVWVYKGEILTEEERVKRLRFVEAPTPVEG